MLRLLCLAALLPAGACGYAFTYGGGSPQRPTTNARVEPLLDGTAEGWLGPVVTERMRQRLGAPSTGSLQVHGEVTQVQAGNIPVARPGGVAAGLVVIRVQGFVRVSDARGAVLKDRVEREGQAEYVVGASVSETEDMRRLALERAAQALADALADAVAER